ncbi:MAG: aminoacyl-tRNA deacylase [Anaerolineae bacterium]
MAKRDDSEQPRTNATRRLDQDGIAYKVHAFSPSIRSATDVAAAVGMPESRVFKTLVAIADDEQPILAVLPGDRELDTKALARACGAKRCQMASQRKAERLTGLKVGGISALALRERTWDVYLDESALAHDSVLVSAGKRGVNVELGVKDLVAVTGASVAKLCRPES